MPTKIPPRTLPLALAAALALAACGPARQTPQAADTHAATPVPDPTADRPSPVTDRLSAPPAPPAPPTAPALAREARSLGALKAMQVAGAPMRIASFAPVLPVAVNTEHYTHRDSNPVQLTSEQPVSIR